VGASGRALRAGSFILWSLRTEKIDSRGELFFIPETGDRCPRFTRPSFPGAATAWSNVDRQRRGSVFNLCDGFGGKFSDWNHWALSGSVSVPGSDRATSANAGIMSDSPELYNPLTVKDRTPASGSRRLIRMSG
jgi:hypothetical protein